jgi:hypothetical protein
MTPSTDGTPRRTAANFADLDVAFPVRAHRRRHDDNNARRRPCRRATSARLALAARDDLQLLILRPRSAPHLLTDADLSLRSSITIFTSRQKPRARITQL